MAQSLSRLSYVEPISVQMEWPTGRGWTTYALRVTGVFNATLVGMTVFFPFYPNHTLHHSTFFLLFTDPYEFFLLEIKTKKSRLLFFPISLRIEDEKPTNNFCILLNEAILLGLCVSNLSKVMYFWKIQYDYDIESKESAHKLGRKVCPNYHNLLGLLT